MQGQICLAVISFTLTLNSVVYISTYKNPLNVTPRVSALSLLAKYTRQPAVSRQSGFQNRLSAIVTGEKGRHARRTLIRAVERCLSSQKKNVTDSRSSHYPNEAGGRPERSAGPGPGLDSLPSLRGDPMPMSSSVRSGMPKVPSVLSPGVSNFAFFRLR
jgi:hypothetical protein